MAIDIWCTRCGSHLDWEGETIPIGPDRRWQVSFRWTAAMAGAAVRRRLQVVIGAARTALSRLASEARARIKRPSAPRPATGRPRLPVPRPPALSASARAVLAAGAVVMVALAAVVLSATAARTSNGSHPAASRTSAAAVPAGSALAAAVPAVQAASGVRFSTGSCQPGRCLKFAGEVHGLNAAAVEFSLGDGRACAAYLSRERGAWQPVAARCAPASQLAPMIGRRDTVHVPGNCANVRKSASLDGGVVACLGDGTAVTLDAGPNASAGHLWWHLQGLGWMAQDFLLR